MWPVSVDGAIAVFTDLNAVVWMSDLSAGGWKNERIPLRRQDSKIMSSSKRFQQ